VKIFFGHIENAPACWLHIEGKCARLRLAGVPFVTDAHLRESESRGIDDDVNVLISDLGWSRYDVQVRGRGPQASWVLQIANSKFRLAIRFLLLMAFVWGSAASAQMLTVDEAETLVRATCFEGMPGEEARRIGSAGAARLAQILADSDESSIHGQIMLALGHLRRHRLRGQRRQ
jgi:hypothetical protein